jgi:hypothetical protein
MEERGFSKMTDDGGVKISKSAFIESRMFSKLVVSVTKEYELIPEIVGGCDKSHFIDSLNMPPKCIAIIKKAHGVKNEGENEGWLEDSGICNDLRAEFGGTKMSKPKFCEVIEERYPDAPENIKDKLISLGIIGENEDNIEIR